MIEITNVTVQIFKNTILDKFKYADVKTQGIIIGDVNSELSIYIEDDNKIDELIELLIWLKEHNWMHKKI